MFSENRGDVTLPVRVDSPVAEVPISKGMIGVGTWNTEAEFKDIQVTAPDGKVLFTSDFSRNSNGWKELGGGRWSVQDGALQQHAEKEFCPRDCRRQIVDGLHAHTQGAQTRRA